MTEAVGLDSLPAGAAVFIDANVFVYALGGRSEQCREFLARCSREEVYGVTLYDVVADVTHRLMISEAVAKGLVSRGNAATLKKRPDVVKGLEQYWVLSKRMLDLNLMFIGLDKPATVAAHEERQQSGLLTKDSLIVACMRSRGLQMLASADRDFDRVRGIIAYAPSDVV